MSEQKIQLSSLHCPSCTATINDFLNKKTITCEYCGTTSQVIQPSKINILRHASDSPNEKLANSILILHNALKGENYEEAYRYCNKYLELDPSIVSIWENKAICVFWMSIKNDSDNVLEKIKEIRVLMSTSRELDPNSETYNDIANAIGYNLTPFIIKKFKSIKRDSFKIIDGKQQPAFSDAAIKKMKFLIESAAETFELMVNKDTRALKFFVDEFSNKGKLIWFEPKSKFTNPKSINDFNEFKYGGIQAKYLRNSFIEKYEPNYIAPGISYNVNYKPYILMGVVGLIIIIIILNS